MIKLLNHESVNTTRIRTPGTIAFEDAFKHYMATHVSTALGEDFDSVYKRSYCDVDLDKDVLRYSIYTEHLPAHAKAHTEAQYATELKATTVLNLVYADESAGRVSGLYWPIRPQNHTASPLKHHNTRTDAINEPSCKIVAVVALSHYRFVER